MPLKDADLAQHYGSQTCTRWSMLFPRMALSEGALYVAENGGANGAFWLMDAIASHVGSYRRDTFAVATLQKRPADWLLTIDDGNGKVYVKQEIEFSDFPLDSIKLYLCKNDDVWVILLPSEY